jgi:hypothetical protein
MATDIVFFSRTGTTRIAAEILAKCLKKSGDVNLFEIKTKRKHSYFFWLFLSFIPYAGVKIRLERVVSSGVVFICFPKWTLNCPPVTSFLRQVDLSEKIVYLIITYGGFDEKRYAEAYKEKVKKVCKEVKDVLLVKKSEIQEMNFDIITHWLGEVF